MNLNDMNERQRQMYRAYTHYVGQPPNPLIPTPGQPDDNLIISLGRLIVDKGAFFLMGQSIESSVADPAAVAGDPSKARQAEPKQTWLDECWRRNKRGITLLKLATNGGIFGHAFVRILDSKPFPRVIVLDPQTITVMTDPDDIDTVWRYTITPPVHKQDEEADAEPVQRRTIIANPSGLAAQRTNGNQDVWVIVDQELIGGGWVNTSTLTWPYSFCPIVHCQNLPRPNDFWGEPDLPEDVLKVLDGLNRVASNYNKIIRIHAHPKVFSVGMGQANLDMAIDAIISLPSPEADLRVLEMKSDLSATMAFLEKLLDLLSFMVKIPMVAMGQPDNLGAISGVALQIRYQPLLEKTEAKRLTYGDLLVELDRCLLSIAGAGDANINTLRWPDLLPANLLEERQVAVLDDSLGVASRETIAERFGLNWEEEQKRITEEKQADIAAGLSPDPSIPPPSPVKAVEPDIAKHAKSL